MHKFNILIEFIHLGKSQRDTLMAARVHVRERGTQQCESPSTTFWRESHLERQDAIQEKQLDNLNIHIIFLPPATPALIIVLSAAAQPRNVGSEDILRLLGVPVQVHAQSEQKLQKIEVHRSHLAIPPPWPRNSIDDETKGLLAAPELVQCLHSHCERSFSRGKQSQRRTFDVARRLDERARKIAQNEEAFALYHGPLLRFARLRLQHCLLCFTRLPNKILDAIEYVEW